MGTRKIIFVAPAMQSATYIYGIHLSHFAFVGATWVAWNTGGSDNYTPRKRSLGGWGEIKM